MVDDGELLEAWCAGDRVAGEELFLRRVGEVTRFFRNKVSDDSDVADLVSQTFLGMTQSKDRYRRDSSLRRFVFTIAKNVLYSHIRAKYKRAREASDYSVLCVGELAPKTPSSIMMRQRSGQAFVNGLRNLPLADQIVLELKCFEDLTGPQIADALDLPEGTVRSRILRATQRLRAIVAASLAATETASGVASPDDLEKWAAAERVQLGRDGPAVRAR